MATLPLVQMRPACRAGESGVSRDRERREVSRASWQAGGRQDEGRPGEAHRRPRAGADHVPARATRDAGHGHADQARPSRHGRGSAGRAHGTLSNAERARLGREAHHLGLPARLALCGLVVAVLAVVMLAGPFGSWYVAWRESARLAQDYAALAQENDELQGEVDALLTPDGVKDKARSLGYVEKGETRVVVSGIPDASSGDSADASSPDGEPASTEAAEPWYIRLLDDIYGYQGA